MARLPGDLTPPERACLIDMLDGPLELRNRWAADGERRLVLFWGRNDGSLEHASATLCRLAGRGFADFDPAKCIILTPRGRDAALALRLEAAA